MLREADVLSVSERARAGEKNLGKADSKSMLQAGRVLKSLLDTSE